MPFKLSITIIRSILLGLAIFFYSCERDDICAESTPTTPNLIIDFFDINDNEASKAVNGLSIRSEEVEDYIIFNSDTDMASLPLSFTEEGVITTNRFLLIKDQDLDDDDDASTNSNTDVVEISFTPEFVYVSRACGYKSIFNNVQIRLIDDGDNWILNTEINIPNIETEDETHLFLFH